MDSNQSPNLNNQNGNEWPMSQQKNQTQGPDKEKHLRTYLTWNPVDHAEQNQVEASVDNPTLTQNSNEGKHQRTYTTWIPVQHAEPTPIRKNQVEMLVDNPTFEQKSSPASIFGSI